MTALCLAAIIGGSFLLHPRGGALPPPQPPPELPADQGDLSDPLNPERYRMEVEADARRAGVPVPTLEQLRRPNAVFREFSGERELAPGARLETPHLLLRAGLRKAQLGDAARGAKVVHLTLSIKNRSARPLAYRVVTSMPAACERKGTLGHNALALRPGETATRTECRFRPVRSVLVKEVQVMELSPLGHAYVSRLEPRSLLFDLRAADGHLTGALPPCKVMPWRVVQRALRGGKAEWYDVVDFYSRHNCDIYTFFEEYRRSAHGPAALPVAPPR